MTLTYMKVTYLNTLYHTEDYFLVTGKIEFTATSIKFSAGGHGREIALEYVISIESVDND